MVQEKLKSTETLLCSWFFHCTAAFDLKKKRTIFISSESSRGTNLWALPMQICGKLPIEMLILWWHAGFGGFAPQPPWTEPPPYLSYNIQCTLKCDKVETSVNCSVQCINDECNCDTGSLVCISLQSVSIVVIIFYTLKCFLNWWCSSDLDHKQLLTNPVLSKMPSTKSCFASYFPNIGLEGKILGYMSGKSRTFRSDSKYIEE